MTPSPTSTKTPSPTSTKTPLGIEVALPRGTRIRLNNVMEMKTDHRLSVDFDFVVRGGLTRRALVVWIQRFVVGSLRQAIVKAHEDHTAADPTPLTTRFHRRAQNDRRWMHRHVHVVHADVPSPAV